MNLPVRCYYKDSEGLHQVNVTFAGFADTYESAINDVKDLLIQGGNPESVYRRVLAVVNQGELANG